MSQKEDFIKTALAEVGVREEKNNKIKYNDWYYGGSVSGSCYGWCSVFISWCAHKCGIGTDIIPRTNYCPTMVSKFKKTGYKTPSDGYVPKPGDIIFFDFDKNGSANHVGIVISVSGSKITTVEGNSNNAVRKIIRNTGDENILGYGIPPFKDTSAVSDNITASESSVKSGDKLTLRRCPIYISSTARKKAGTITGAYYIWSGIPVNGRYRVTNHPSRVGVKKQITGWIDASCVIPEVT